ncbi:urease accessory protein UreD [Deinococcus hopiensis]|uniref:Urease accessory protein UreD n=1 Tax=Deinococcus hopiensis KR-140 TaxID=695939 RepID=A0A1W1UCE9_9DEIO|nr:urease accessory protein UreD [Deinococcus hopiensis]SMB78713.1 urease accessory protein [Deinococcus hopiensis KR-140]
MTLLRRTRTGVLHLHFGMRAGRTCLLRDTQKAPLMIVRPFTLPCGTLMVFVVNPTGGVLGGDHSEIHVRVEGGARALVLTQSATRVQPSPMGEAATQDILLEVAAGGRLEFYPERTLPFAGSAFRQTLRAELEEDAELGFLETLASGRVGSGERLQFREYTSRVEVRRGGKRVYLDALHLCPGPHTPAPGILGHCDYLASGVWVGGGPVADWPAVPGHLATGSTAGGAVWLRGASERGPVLDAELARAREALRRQLFNAVPLQVRR